MSNIVKRNATPTMASRIPKPHMPKWVAIYWTYLKQVLGVIGVVIGAGIAFLFPVAVAITLMLRAGMGEIPKKHVLHGAGWIWLGWAVLCLFWYTGVFAFFHYHEQQKRHNRRNY